jgi:TRAP-type C4-dicarboxylate transport system substrate-binding protein
MKRAVVAVLLMLTVLTSRAPADEARLMRIASPAPEGTTWAREAHAFARDIEALTHGTIRVKFYFGGITGDEIQTTDRIRRGQLDGMASGGMACMQIAPSMRVLRVLGVFQSRDESAYVSGRLRATLDEEFAKAGFVNLGEIGIGPDLIFTREPARSMAELRKLRIWNWDLDPIYAAELQAMGMQVVKLPLDQAAHAYTEGKTDGFVAVPAAALAFQWSTQARYATDLHVGFLRGCFLMSTRSWDLLTVEQQQAVREANARVAARLEQLGREQDDALLHGGFQKQGLQLVPASAELRSEFFAEARAAREKLGEQLVPQALLQRVLGMLADYRAEHR